MPLHKSNPRQKPEAVNRASLAPETRRYHPTEYAADYLGLSKRFLEGQRANGGGPEFVTFGKAIRYTLDALDAWAASRARKPTPEHEAA